MNKTIVSERALIKRINRKLAQGPRPEKLCKTRPESRAWLDLGDYYVRDIYRNLIMDNHVDVTELAKDLNVIAEYEEMEGVS